MWRVVSGAWLVKAGLKIETEPHMLSALYFFIGVPAISAAIAGIWMIWG